MLISEIYLLVLFGMAYFTYACITALTRNNRRMHHRQLWILLVLVELYAWKATTAYIASRPAVRDQVAAGQGVGTERLRGHGDSP